MGLMTGPLSCDHSSVFSVYIGCLRLGRRQRAKVVEDSSGWIIVNQEDCNMSCSESGSDDIPLGAQALITYNDELCGCCSCKIISSGRLGFPDTGFGK